MIGEIIMIACLSFLAALAWYPCCCGGGGSVGVDCINCSGVTRDTVSVTISGAGNEDCDNCAPVIDGTIILPQTSNECVYSAWNSQDLGCSNANPTSYWQIKAQVNAGYWTVIITAYNSHGGSLWTNTVNYKWDSGGSSPIDCTLYRDLSLSSSGSAGLGPACDLDGLTMSLIPS